MYIARTRPIYGELLKLKDEIRKYVKECNLDFFEVVFEVCDYETINILASLGGFPSRYPHWRFGMDYDQLSKGTTYGLQKIYEMVINNDPSYAYLLKSNNLVDQKIVIAHVYGHSDFFKNNAWFSGSNRHMIDVMANHGTKIRRYIEKYGQETVELFIDTVLSLENLLDTNQLFETAELQRSRRELDNLAVKELANAPNDDERSQALKSFMRSKINKKDESKDKTAKKRGKDNRPQKKIMQTKLPCADIMKVLMEHSPLEDWQIDVLGIFREEAYYFLPQRLTKIMNEGWASYWHSHVMTNYALRSSEIIDYADHHAGVMVMSKQQINPYKIGIELFRDIEFRWNTGRFGKEYNECQSMRDKLNWDTKANQGRAKIFEIRKSHNDLTFIDEYLTADFCNRAKLFTYKYNQRTNRFEIDTRDFAAIKMKLLTQLTNYGTPLIEVEDINFANRGEMLLVHRHDGVDLDMTFAADTMKNIFAIWSRPINLRTVYDNKEVVFVFNGKELRPL